ncbi:Rieske (2Fe-2S) protein [Variovorax sp. ZS18.2.2]|uniref:Rieske (2Fe-2S) protein n=1 Tax=Variovorax sp. ZS18.2.2 TaxID=2971255 RepID=UPI002151C381|nr:Rieske (2Fe-2S) protein [Variovorax sp. ZS18.2.2]MCR6477929.1 Rieske (2Fe-2S) protein [Variovorax sp. ZS18.2.2]
MTHDHTTLDTAKRQPIATDLADGGLAATFTTPGGESAFAVRWNGGVYSYLNQCPHAGGPLDFEGLVLESSGRFLMCARHGAIFEPDTGKCVGGPCRGARLTSLAVREAADGSVWLID